jgi:hypothetical protein
MDVVKLGNEWHHEFTWYESVSERLLASGTWQPCMRWLNIVTRFVGHTKCLSLYKKTKFKVRANIQRSSLTVIHISSDVVCHERTGVESPGTRQVRLNNCTWRNRGLGFGTGGKQKIDWNSFKLDVFKVWAVLVCLDKAFCHYDWI